jgi:hypothetical protein
MAGSSGKVQGGRSLVLGGFPPRLVLTADFLDGTFYLLPFFLVFFSEYFSDAIDIH